MIAAATRLPGSLWRRASDDAYTAVASVLGVTTVLGLAVAVGLPAALRWRRA
ncbi:MAG: hypothetical protein R3F62_04100 [Planctomycetota bacterium]